MPSYFHEYCRAWWGMKMGWDVVKLRFRHVGLACPCPVSPARVYPPIRSPRLDPARSEWLVDWLIEEIVSERAHREGFWKGAWFGMAMRLLGLEEVGSRGVWVSWGKRRTSIVASPCYRRDRVRERHLVSQARKEVGLVSFRKSIPRHSRNYSLLYNEDM